jgi:hypothetical protein
MDLPGLTFHLGVGVQAPIRVHSDELVNLYLDSGPKEFFLLIFFAHCMFRLNSESNGFILQATIGGIASDFRPIHVSDRVFKFVVASRNVGFHLYKLAFSCEQYKVFFHL